MTYKVVLLKIKQIMSCTCPTKGGNSGYRGVFKYRSEKY
jgi:hypothetical protein